MKEKSIEQDPHLIGTTISAFVLYYNKNIPETFPRASLPALEKFQTAHPGLFKGNSEWIIDKHRKKLMDWLASYSQEK